MGRLAPPSLPPASGPTALAPLPAPGPAEAPPASAGALLGAGPEQLLARFGAPQLRREEAGAQIWLYATPACQLDLVLYPEAGTARVAHAQARAGGLAQRTEAACLREIAARRRPPARATPSWRMPEGAVSQAV
jgi:hypothetical protein